jgi:hypothetical protein
MVTENTEEVNTPSAEASDELRRLDKEWVEALVKADTATLSRITADDFVFTYPLEGDSKQQFIEDVASGQLRVESLKRDRIDVYIYGSTGVLTALDTSTWDYKGHHILGYYRIIAVYSLRGGLWQLVMVQACPLAQP